MVFLHQLVESFRTLIRASLLRLINLIHNKLRLPLLPQFLAAATIDVKLLGLISELLQLPRVAPLEKQIHQSTAAHHLRVTLVSTHNNQLGQPLTHALQLHHYLQFNKWPNQSLVQRSEELEESSHLRLRTSRKTGRKLTFIPLSQHRQSKYSLLLTFHSNNPNDLANTPQPNTNSSSGTANPVIVDPMEFLAITDGANKAWAAHGIAVPSLSQSPFPPPKDSEDIRHAGGRKFHSWVPGKVVYLSAAFNEGADPAIGTMIHFPIDWDLAFYHSRRLAWFYSENTGNSPTAVFPIKIAFATTGHVLMNASTPPSPYSSSPIHLEDLC